MEKNNRKFLWKRMGAYPQANSHIIDKVKVALDLSSYSNQKNLIMLKVLILKAINYLIG